MPEAERDLRAELYEHIQRLSLSFFSRKRTGGLITRVSSDTDRLWEFLESSKGAAAFCLSGAARGYCPGQTWLISFWKLYQLFAEVVRGAPK